MNIKQTDTLIRVRTNRAETFKELTDAGWDEPTICAYFSDARQAFVWNAKLKQAVKDAHLKYVNEEGKVAYHPFPEQLTPEMIVTAQEFADAHPNSFEIFEADRGIAQSWLKKADESTTLKALASAKNDKERAAITQKFVDARGFEPTRENIAAAIKRDYEAKAATY